VIAAGLGRIALVAAVAGAGVGAWASLTGRVAAGRRALAATAALAGLATACLAWALVAGDFSLVYVADATSRAMSWPYRLEALWGGMEGSLLLWVFLLAVHGALAAAEARRRAAALQAGTQAVLGALIAAFLLVVLTVADPFARLAVPAVDGGGLTPVLEHPAMLYHPPLLYLGQTGLAIPFALTVAALASGTLDGVWLAAARRSALVAWVLLSVGMLAGARWAYVELGWGGFWAWDPVENGSLMPWLATTAFIHGAMATARRAERKALTAGLALSGFGLALLGGFLTRSGATESVHAFAEARAVGVALLVLLAVCVGGSAAMLVARRARFSGGDAPPARLWSKEAALLVNHAVLLSAVIVVAAGTLVPVISRAVGGSRIVVSPGFFAVFTAPLALAVLALAGIGPLLPWSGRERSGLRSRAVRPAGAGAGGGLGVALALGFRGPFVLAGFGLGGVSLALLVVASSAPGRRRQAGVLAHVGVVVLLLGVLGSTQGIDEAAVLGVGDELRIGPYVLVHRGLVERDGERRQEVRARLDVIHSGRRVGEFRPGLDAYQRGTAALPETALDSTPRQDLLVAVRRIDRARGEILVQAFVRPLVTWVWWGGLLLVAGGAWALSRYPGGSPRSRRLRSRSRPRVAGGAGAAGTGSGSGGVGGAGA
jgi:cytochrome c-type biogenesis protein CcmF